MKQEKAQPKKPPKPLTRQMQAALYYARKNHLERIAAQLRQGLAPSGIASSEAMGTPTVTQV